MAFDMYLGLGEERTYIEHHEEGLFELINDDDQYPRLNWVWAKFYDGPVIQPNIANELVHELINLRKLIAGERESKHLLVLIDRILPFFGKAYTRGELIKCVSD